MQTTEKTCFKCLCKLPLEDFYKHAAMGDGRLGKCKNCTKKDVEKHRQENLDEIRQYDRMRALQPHRMAKNFSVNQAYRLKYPNRVKANRAVNNAVRDGRLEKWPCEVCGSEKSVGHHPDYDRPLDVIWLCQPHHKQAHAMVF
jgi:hypothetical protein